MKTRLQVQSQRKKEAALVRSTERLRLRYLLFMWHVFREAFFSEILKQEKEMATQRSDPEKALCRTRPL